MRVLHVTANYHPSIGGIERFVEILAEGLTRRGHTVTVLCCREGSAPFSEQDGDVRVERIPASQFPRTRFGVPYPLPSPRALYRKLRHEVAAADVVHVHDAIYATSVAALRASRSLRRRSVLTQHVGFIPQASRTLDLAQRAAILTLGRSIRLADRVVAYNSSVASWARSTWGVDVALLPIGVPAPVPPREPRDAIRRAFALPSDRFLALFVGRDVPKKRLDLVVAASDPEFDVVAVTDRAASGSTSSGVRLLPFMPHEALQRLLFAVDAFVLPSEAEGFPLSLQEALLVGLPCVVTREPGYEQFVSEDDVVFVQPEPGSIRQALRRLASDPSSRCYLGGRARAVAQRAFSVDACVTAYEQLYHAVLQERFPPPT